MLVTNVNTAFVDSAIHRRLPPRSFVTVTLLVGLFLRILAACGDLWLDEIWSLELAQQASSPLGILTELRHDNNHTLNTFYLRLLGPGHTALAYRFAATLCGTLSIPLAGLIVRRWGQVESLTAMTLFATSCIFVHYSTEARGYGFLVLFVLASIESLLRHFESGERRWILAFTGCSLGGLLSHPVFVQFSLAMAIGTLFVLHRSAGSWQRALKQTVSCHAGAIALTFVIYKAQWSTMELGGGPAHSLIAKLSETFSLMLGGPTYGVGAMFVAAQCVAAIAFGLWVLSQSKTHMTTLVALGVVIPLVQVVALRPPFLFVRYFLIAMIFGMFAIAAALGHVYQRGVSGKWVYACLLSGFLAANTWHTIELVRLGRGDYRGALEFIAQSTSSPRITIGSDHDFGVGKLIQFYGPIASPHRRFEYIGGQSWPASGPQWVVLHRDAEDLPAPVNQRLEIEEHSFELARVFDCAPLSGWRLLCYRRLPMPPSVR